VEGRKWACSLRCHHIGWAGFGLKVFIYSWGRSLPFLLMKLYLIIINNN
jgi:hypothetical protein